MKSFVYVLIALCITLNCTACKGEDNSSSFNEWDFGSNQDYVLNIDYHKPTFRWLDIGNSHSLCALKYLRYIAISQEVDLSNIAFCRVSRGGSSFSSWYQGLNNNDFESGDTLTGNKYILTKDFGGLNVHVKGSFSNPSTNRTDFIDKDLSRTQTVFYGHDTSILKSLLKDNDWDLITIHQRYIFNDLYEESNGWIDDLDTTYSIRNSGSADLFIQTIKELCPKAKIGYLFALLPFGYENINTQIVYDEKTIEKTHRSFNEWCNSIRKIKNDLGIDVVLPCETALENIRMSSVANEGGESILSRYGFNYDNAHTAYGVAAYTMASVAWEIVFAPRFNKSIWGNKLVELEEDDIVTSNGKYLQPSYINQEGQKIIIDKDDGAWNKPVIVGYTSNDSGVFWSQSDRVKATLRLSDVNNKTCQKAALLAVKDMWKVNNPDNKK